MNRNHLKRTSGGARKIFNQQITQEALLELVNVADDNLTTDEILAELDQQIISILK